MIRWKVRIYNITIFVWNSLLTWGVSRSIIYILEITDLRPSLAGDHKHLYVEILKDFIPDIPSGSNYSLDDT